MGNKKKKRKAKLRICSKETSFNGSSWTTTSTVYECPVCCSENYYYIVDATKPKSNWLCGICGYTCEPDCSDVPFGYLAVGIRENA